MPWYLVAPRTGKTPYWYVRGKYLGHAINCSTGTGEAVAARRILKTWREQAERGEFGCREAEPKTGTVTFPVAAEAYMLSGGDGQYLEPILLRWPSKPIADIDQIALDTIATGLYPKGTPQTRNRQVYTPVISVLHHSGIEKKFRRPKGWKGNRSTSWLEHEPAMALLKAAYKIEPEFGLLCHFLLYTGMRLDEALTRRLGDLKLDRAFIYLEDSKNENPRGCHLPPHLVQAFIDQPPRKPRDEVVTAAKKGVKGFVKGGRGVGRNVEDAGVAFLKRHSEARLFRFHDGGALRDKLKAAMKACGLSFPKRQGGFHIFCHTYGSWMHRWGELDAHGLTRTGRWSDPSSAFRYVHTMASEEARRSDWLPTPTGGLNVGNRKARR